MLTESEYTAPAKRVMSLKQPHLKMSKSHADPKSRILITDNPENIRQKIGVAMTDSQSGISYDPTARPGVSNLLDIMSHLENGTTSSVSLAKEYEFLSLRQFKEQVSERLISGLAGIRAAYDRILLADEGRYLDSVAAKGAEKARDSAEATMVLVRQHAGL